MSSLKQVMQVIGSHHISNQLLDSDCDKSGGIISNGEYAWFAAGANIILYSKQLGSIVSSRSFAANQKDKSLTITFVQELHKSEERTNLLLVGCSFKSYGILFICQLPTLTTIRCIHIPNPISYISTIKNETLAEDQLCDEFKVMSTVLLVGMATGAVYAVDLRQHHIENQLRRNEIVVNELRPSKLFIIRKNEDCQEVKEMSDDSDCHLAMFLNENFCIYCKKQYSGKLNFNISSLFYNEEINTVAIGYSTGHFQLWDCKMMRTIYLLKEPKCVMPVTHITFLEPSDDPNNLCYLWVIQSDNSRLPNAMMIALTYEQRTMMSNGCLSYRLFKGNGIKLEMSLRRETGIGRCISATSLCNVNLFRNETDLDEDCEIRLFAMLMEIRQNVEASPESYIFLFDINQWYKAQMPSNINHLKVSNSYASFVKLPHNGSYLDLNIYGKTLRPFGYNFRNNVEELYYPSSIYFECDCLLDTEIIRFKHAGVQQEILDQLLLKNWRLLINPSLIFSQCLQTNLRPFFWDKTDDYVNYSLPDKRSFVISIIVENKIMSVLSACAEEWKNGTYVSSEATILHLVQCLWKHVMVVKQYADKLCVPLFDYSGTQLGKKNERILNHCLSQMLCVKHFLENLHNAYGIHIINVDYSYRVYTLNLVTQYFKAVTCFLSYGLLPESIEEDPTQKFIQCDFTSLIEYAIKRRMEFGDLPLYLIDAFVTNEPKGNKLIEQWQHEGGEATKGLYPPSNVQCLLRIYLNAALSNQVKDFITIYFLIDICSSQEVNATTANRMCNFAIEFDIENKGLNTLCRASWLLDHDMFEEAMDILASNNEWMVNDKSWDWYHWTVLKLLVFRKQYFWARFYFQLIKINLINIEDHKFYINLQIMNNQCFDTLIYLRARPFKEKQTLFEYFFDRCRETKKLKCLIEYLWEMEEAELFLSYLKKFDDTETLTFQLLFLLQRGRHREAIKLNQTLKASLTSNNNDVLKITSVLIDGLEKTIPNIMSQNYDRLSPQSVYKKPNVVVKCMNNESKMFIMDRNKTSTLVKRKIDSFTPSNSIDLFLPANTNTRKRSPVDDIICNEKRKKIEENSLNTPITDNEIVKPIEKQVLEILNTPLVEKTIASPSISRCSSILKTKLALNIQQIISLDIDKTSRSLLRFDVPCNDAIVKRIDPENVVNVQHTGNPENESFYSVSSNDANELTNQISSDQIPITFQESLKDDSKMNISDECEKMDISEENSCSEQKQFKMDDALENNIKNKAMDADSSSENQECIILLSDEEDDKETPISIKEDDKEIFDSNEEDDKEIVISDEEYDQEICISDEEDENEIPISDEEDDKKTSVSIKKDDKEIPVSDEEDDNEIPISDEEDDKEIPISDGEDDKEIPISDEDYDKETPLSASLPKNTSSSFEEGIKLSTPKSVSIDKKKTLNPHRIVWNRSVLNSKSNNEKPVLKTNKVIEVISLDSDSDESEVVSNNSFSEKSSGTSGSSIISEDSDLENTRYGRFKSQRRQYNEDSDDDELDEENEEEEFEEEEFEEEEFEEEEEEIDFSEQDCEEEEKDIDISEQECEEEEKEIDISEQYCEEEESEREDENVSDPPASLCKKNILKNTSVYDLDQQTVKFDENYEEEKEEKEIDISEQDCEEEEKEIDISEQDCEEEEKEIDISEHDCEEEEKEIDISEHDCEEEEKEIDISEHDCEEEESEREDENVSKPHTSLRKKCILKNTSVYDLDQQTVKFDENYGEEEEIDISEQDCKEEEESEREDENVSNPHASLSKKCILKNTSVYDLDQQTIKFDENYGEEEEIDISEQDCKGEEESEREDENVSNPHASLSKKCILKNTSVYDLDQQTVKFDENYGEEEKEIDISEQYCEEEESEREDENVSDPPASLFKKNILKNTSVYDLDQQTVKFDENYEEEEKKEIDISEQDCKEEEESEREDENVSNPHASLSKKCILKNTSVYDLDQQTVKFDENYEEEEKKEIDISEHDCEGEFKRKDENVSDPHASLCKKSILKNTSVYDLDQQTVKFDGNYEEEEEEDKEEKENYRIVNFPGNKVIGSENNDDDFENNSVVLFNNENEDDDLDDQETLEYVKNDETSKNLASKSSNVNEDNFKDNHCDDTSSNKHHSFETLRNDSNPIPDDGFNHHTVIESDQVEVDVNQSTSFMFGESYFGQQEIPEKKPVLLFGHVYSFENEQSDVNAQFNNHDTQELVLVNIKEDITNKGLEIEAEGEIQDISKLESLPESNIDDNIDTQKNATNNVQPELKEKNNKILCDNDQNGMLGNSSVQKPIYFGNIDTAQVFQIEDQTSVSVDLSKKSLELENEDLVNHESCDVLIIKQRDQPLSNESEKQIYKTEGILPNNDETSINTMETDKSSCIIVAEENTCSLPQRNVETTTQSKQIINIQDEELDSKCSTSNVSCSSNVEQFDNFNDNNQLVKSKDITLQQVDTNVLISTKEKYSDDEIQISDPVSLEPNKTLMKLSTNDNPINMSMSEKIELPYEKSVVELLSTDVTVMSQYPDVSGNIKNTENEKLEKLDKSHQKNSLDIPRVENYCLRSSSRRSISKTKDCSLDIPSKEGQKLTPGKINLLSDPIQNQIIRKAKSVSLVDTKTITTRSRAKSEPKQVQLETISSNIFRSSDMVDDNRRQVRVSLSKKKSKSQENITSIKRRSGRSKSVVPIEESIATNRRTVFGLEEIPEEDTSNAEKNISKTERATLKRKSKFNFLTNTAKKIEHDNLNAKCQENTKIRTPRRSKSVDPDPVLTFSVVKTKSKRSSSVNILISNEEIPTQKDDIMGVLKKALKSPKKIRKRSVSESLESRKKQKTLNQEVEQEKKEVAESEYNSNESNQSSHNSNSSNSCEQLSPIAGNISQHMLYTPAKKRIKIHMANLNSENEDSSSDESTDSKRIMTRSMIQNSSIVELDPIPHTLKSEIRPLVKSKVPINRQRKLSVGNTSKIKSPTKSAASLSEKNELLPKRKAKNIKETIVHAPIEPSIEPPTPERRMTRFQQSILEKSLQSTSIIGQDTTTNNSPASKLEKKKNIKKKI